MTTTTPSETTARKGINYFDISLFLLVIALAFFLSSSSRADVDLWGHLKFGQDICKLGKIPADDPYSYMTTGQNWINHEWLAEVLLARFYGFFAYAGINLLKVLLLVPLIAGIYSSLLARSGDSCKSFLLLAAAMQLLKIGTQVARPHLFTYVFLGATLYVLTKIQEGKRGWIVCLVPVFILWANTHGGFIAGLCLIFLWTGCRIIELFFDRSSGHENKFLTVCPVLLPAIVSLLSVLVNPYGAGLIAFLLKTATVPRPDITEWDPVRLSSAEGMYYFLFVLLTAAIFLFNRQKPRLPDLALWAALAAGPLVAYRHLPLAAIGCCFIAGKYLSGFPARSLNLSESIGSKRKIYASLAALSALVFLGLTAKQFDKITIGYDDFPIKAVQLLQDAKAKGNLTCYFDWGEYIIWKLGPQVKVSMDGRRETVYAAQARQDYENFAAGTAEWERMIDCYDTNMVLVTNGQPSYNLMKLKPGWSLAYEDQICGLFLKEGDPLAERIRTASHPERQ